jgi:hypothetical protein
MLNNKICWWVVCLIIGLAGAAIASRPQPRQASDYLICSQSASYCADSSVGGKVDVFRMDKGQRISCYSIETGLVVGYDGRAYLSDDGKKYVVVNEMIPEDFINYWPALEVWSNGNLSQKLNLHQILDLTKCKPILTSDGDWWCFKVIGFEGPNRFVIQLIGDRLKPHKGPRYVIELD